MSTLHYQTGFGNSWATEALPGALPVGRNSPQICPYGLYAEQLSGTAFTAPRADNRRSWLYRIRPAAAQQPFEPYEGIVDWLNTFGDGPVTPNPLRWDPQPVPEQATDFIHSIRTWAGHGSPDEHAGVSINLYAANRSMQDSYFYNADGEMLIVPQEGRLRLATEVLRTYRRARRLMHDQPLDRALAALRAGAPAAPPGLGGPEQQFAAFRLGRAVVLILALLPTDRRCLVRSLTLSGLLARRAIPARLVLGVRPDSSEPFLAHAWVEHDGVAVSPDEGYNRLHEL